MPKHMPRYRMYIFSVSVKVRNITLIIKTIHTFYLENQF